MPKRRPIWRKGLDDLVPYEPGKRASELAEEVGLARMVKLSSNETPFSPTDLAVTAMCEVAGRVNRYPDGGCRALRDALAAFLGVEVGNVLIGSGSNELIRLIAQTIANPGDEIVMAKPSFVVYPMVAKMFGAAAVEIALTKDWRLDLAAMAKAVSRKTKIVFLANPNNPTGTIYTRDEFEAFLGGVPKRVLVVIDEAYFEFVESSEYPNGMDYFSEEGNVVVLRTFSKIYGLAGLRIGYGAAPSELGTGIDKVREPFNVNTVAQVAAFASLKCGAEIELRKHLNAEARDQVCGALDKLGIEHATSHANFVFVKVPDGQKAFKDLLEHGVIVRAFGDAPFVRITFGNRAENSQLIAALEAVFG